jgi:hypothetical protein
LVVHIHPCSYDERNKLEYSGRKGMESIQDSMDPKAKEEHEEEHEYSKKENLEQPTIIPRIIRLPTWFEPTRRNQPEEMEVVMKNNVYNKM